MADRFFEALYYTIQSTSDSNINDPDLQERLMRCTDIMIRAAANTKWPNSKARDQAFDKLQALQEFLFARIPETRSPSSPQDTTHFRP
jgi:hypothetical protein